MKEQYTYKILKKSSEETGYARIEIDQADPLNRVWNIEIVPHNGPRIHHTYRDAPQAWGRFNKATEDLKKAAGLI